MTAALPLAEHDVVIDYDELYASYLAALIDKLRGLSTHVDYLDLWVPDEDPLVSVRNMLDSAATLGRTNLSVYFGGVSAPQLDVRQLEVMAQRFGVARVTPANAGFVLAVSALRTPQHDAPPPGAAPDAQSSTALRSAADVTSVADVTSAADVGAAPAVPQVLFGAPSITVTIPKFYASALQQAAASLDRLGAGTTELSERFTDGSALLVSDAAGVELHLLVDSQLHVIRCARFEGGASALEQGLLNAFCRVLEGLPLLEAREHAVLRLESQLRDRRIPAPVPGIVSAEAFGDLFELPRRLLHQAYAQYLERSGYQPGPNRYNPQPQARWLGLAEAARRAWLEQVMSEVVIDTTSVAVGVTIAEIRDDVRVILGLPSSWSSADKQRRLMLLEAAIKSQVDGRLEVFAEELKDQNRKRRLAVVDDTRPRSPLGQPSQAQTPSSSEEQDQ